MVKKQNVFYGFYVQKVCLRIELNVKIVVNGCNVNNRHELSEINMFKFTT